MGDDAHPREIHGGLRVIAHGIPSDRAGLAAFARAMGTRWNQRQDEYDKKCDGSQE